MRDELIRAATVFAVIGCVTGCSKPAVVKEPVPPEPPPMIVVSTPTPTPAPTPELAPVGVFYLITSLSMETDSGIHALTPGTGVKHIRGDLYLTPFGEMKLKPEQMTNDMAVARAAKNSALAAQAAIHKNGAMTAAAVSDNAKLDAAMTRDGNLKDLQRSELEKRIQTMTQQKTTLEAQVRLLSEKADRESHARIIGRTVSGSSTEQLTVARTRLSQLEADIRTDTRKLRNMSN